MFVKNDKTVGMIIQSLINTDVVVNELWVVTISKVPKF